MKLEVKRKRVIIVTRNGEEEAVITLDPGEDGQVQETLQIDVLLTGNADGDVHTPTM